MFQSHFNYIPPAVNSNGSSTESSYMNVPIHLTQTICDTSNLVYNENFYGGQTSTATSTSLQPSQQNPIDCYLNTNLRSSMRNPLSTFPPTYPPYTPFGTAFTTSIHSAPQKNFNFNQTNIIQLPNISTTNTPYFNPNDQIINDFIG